MSELDLEGFLLKRAGDEILVQLFDKPQTFSEIVSSVDASRPTISARLSEGVKLEIWHEEIEYMDDGGKRKIYKIKPKFRDSVHSNWISKLRRTIEARNKVRQDHADVVSGLSQGDDPGDVDISYTHDG